MHCIRQKLLKKDRTIGSWISIDHHLIPDLMGHAGFEWLVIDLEHSVIDLNNMSILIDKIKMNSMVPFVRLPEINQSIIKKSLDAGACGVIAPMVKTSQDVLDLISYCFYPPNGKRGVGLFKAQDFGENFEKYKEEHYSEIAIIAQIEHVDAVKNLESILSIPRLDGILVGPYDLSASLGIAGDFSNPIFKNSLEEIITKTKKSSKALGFHVVDTEAQVVIDKFVEGYNFIAFGTDFLFLKNSALNEMKKINQI